MKRPDHAEMDRLLRRYARRNGETLLAGRDESSDEQEENALHLDADELNAYAEGALPESARSRYFAHLADCDSCRKLVTDLTLAVSRADEGKARVAAIASSPSRSWRDWLATIFSPPVLRYGVPALALFAIIVVAIVATRTQRDASFVAQMDEAERNSTQSATANSNSSALTTTTGTSAENHSNSNAVLSANEQKQMQPGAAAPPPPTKTAPIVEDEPNAPLADAAKPAATTPGKANETSNVFGETDKRAEEKTGAPVPQPTPPPAESAATAEASNRDLREAQRKSKVAGKDDDEVRINPKAVGGAVATKSESNEDRTATGRTTARRSIQELPATRPPAQKNEPVDLAAQKERSSETRSIGGRNFRKQGNAWVDTAYKSSLPLTNVARGSEQYRALVADEPELRTITKRLGGEVIVVWKSRAYRFY